jgi:hypothetical protein
MLSHAAELFDPGETASRGQLNSLDDVNFYHPEKKLSLVGCTHTFLQQHNSCEAIVQIPEIRAPKTTLIVESSVHIECFICRNLKFSDSLTGHRAVVNGRIEVIGPRGSIAVAISVVIAQQIVPPRFCAPSDIERLVDGGEEILGEIWHKSGDAVEVERSVSGRKSPQKITGMVQMSFAWRHIRAIQRYTYRALSNFLSFAIVMELALSDQLEIGFQLPLLCKSPAL